MGVGELCGDVEAEVLMVWNDGVSQLYHYRPVLLVCL